MGINLEGWFDTHNWIEDWWCNSLAALGSSDQADLKATGQLIIKAIICQAISYKFEPSRRSPFSFYTFSIIISTILKIDLWCACSISEFISNSTMMEIIACEIVDSLPNTDINSSAIGDVKAWPMPIEPQLKIGSIYCTVKAGIYAFIGHISEIGASVCWDIILYLVA